MAQTPTPEEDESKAKARSVSLSPELWAYVDALVLREYHDIRSRYFQELVQDDMKRREQAKDAASAAPQSASSTDAKLDALAEQLFDKLKAKIAAHDELSARGPAPKLAHRKR